MSKNNIDALIQKYFIARGFPGGSDGKNTFIAFFFNSEWRDGVGGWS